MGIIRIVLDYLEKNNRQQHVAENSKGEDSICVVNVVCNIREINFVMIWGRRLVGIDSLV